MAPAVEFDEIELAGIAGIVAVVAVLAWFTTDTTGVGRLLTVGISALLAGVVAAVSLYVSEL